MARRAAAIKLQREKDPDLLLLSAGDFYGRSGILDMYRSRFLAESMVKMGYTAVAVGERELNYGLRAISADAESGLHVICANLYQGGRRLFPPAVVKKVHGKKVGIFAILGEEPREAEDFEVRDPVDEGLVVLDDLKKKGCEVIILLAHIRKDKLLPMLPLFEDVDLVIRGHAQERGKSAEDCADTLGRAFENPGIPVVFAGDRGRAIGKVSLASIDGAGSGIIDSTIIYLDRSVDEDPELASMLKEFSEEQGRRRREISLSEFLARDKVTGRIKERYLGVEKCRRCHSLLTPRFVLSRHFRAFETLEQPEEGGNQKCLVCHTTGYGRFSGYDPESEKGGGVNLLGVQCEACHGQGTMHSRDGRYKGAARGSCRRCHNAERSPDFDFEIYWERVCHSAAADSVEPGQRIDNQDSSRKY